MASIGEFDLRVDESRDDSVVLHVRGDLDMATAPQLEETLREIDPGRRLVVDLSECTFLDSSAVRVLVVAARTAEGAGAGVSLVTTDPGLRKVLEIAAVDAMLPLYESVESAL